MGTAVEQNSQGKLLGNQGQAINGIRSGCSKLAKKEQKNQDDWVA